MEVVQRRAGRVLAVHGDAVLLLRGSDPARPQDGSWWFTVGGGCEGDESTASAARREAFEEAGLVLPDDLGPVVLHRTAAFSFDGQHYAQTEDFYFCRVDSAAVVTTGWTELERRAMTTHRWWTVAELASTDDVVYPAELGPLLARLLAATGDSAPAGRMTGCASPPGT